MRLTPEQRRLALLLSAATFFEGFDFFALAQVLPNLRAEFDATPGEGGLLVAIANVGTVLAFVLVRAADRVGRGRVFLATIGGYAVASLASAFAPEFWSFALLQLVARVFLVAEYAMAMVIAAEEFPAERRGTLIGVIQGAASLGAIACAALVPALLQTPLGWRSVFLVGTLPLLLLLLARNTVRAAVRPAAPARTGAHILATPYRNRLLLLAAIWALTYACTQNAVTFWKEFAIAERGMSDAQVGASVSLAAALAMPFVFLAGVLIDRLGRRRGAALIFGILILGVIGSYTLATPHALTASLGLGIFGTSAVMPVLNAFTAELFPTELRGEAYAWANNLLGRVGYLLSPLLVGATAASCGFGFAVSATTIFPLVALALIIAFLPETAGRELEETAAL